ncbi:MAG: hypothetical protein ACLFU2_00690 [Opitutales bacterium]
MASLYLSFYRARANAFGDLPPRISVPGRWLGARLLALLLILAFVSPVLWREGWPRDHEWRRNFDRIEVYAQHFARGELFPVWSDSAVVGYGGPFPIYYHKLFYYPAGMLRLLGVSLKGAVVLTLAGFAWLGLAGMQRVLDRWQRGPPAVVTLVAAGFLFSSYAYQLWVVRGAYAEFSAMMLVPWGLLWCWEVIERPGERRWGWMGMALFPALYFAHSIIFFYFAGPVVVAVLIGWGRCAAKRGFAVRMLALGAWFFLLVGPVIGLQQVLGEGFGVFEGILLYRAEEHIWPLSALWWTPDFAWGERWRPLSLAFNPVSLAGVGLGVGWLGVKLWQGRGSWRSPSAEAMLERRRWLAGIGFLAFGLYYVFWMSPLARPLYAAWEAFSLLQFPFRLLCFLTAAVPVFLWIGVGRWVAGRRTPVVAGVFGGYALLFALFSPWVHPIRYEWMPRAEIEHVYGPETTIWVGYAEYAPRIGERDSHGRMDRLRFELLPHPGTRAWETDAYAVARIDDGGFEAGKRRYRVIAEQDATVVLPIAYSPFLRVFAESGEGRQALEIWRTDEDPRVHFTLPAGTHHVQVRYPTVGRTFVQLLREGAP